MRKGSQLASVWIFSLVQVVVVFLHNESKHHGIDVSVDLVFTLLLLLLLRLVAPTLLFLTHAPILLGHYSTLESDLNGMSSRGLTHRFLFDLQHGWLGRGRDVLWAVDWNVLALPSVRVVNELTLVAPVIVVVAVVFVEVGDEDRLIWHQKLALALDGHRVLVVIGQEPEFRLLADLKLRVLVVLAKFAAERIFVLLRVDNAAVDYALGGRD